MSQEKIQGLIDNADRERFRRAEERVSEAPSGAQRKRAAKTSTDTEPFPNGAEGYGRGSRRNKTRFAEKAKRLTAPLCSGVLRGPPTLRKKSPLCWKRLSLALRANLLKRGRLRGGDARR